MIDYAYIVGLNSSVCDNYGLNFSVINKNGILSALGTMQWYEESSYKACSLLRSPVTNHGFRDGNKRTAFLAANSVCPINADDNSIVSCVMSIAKGELTDVELIHGLLY